MNQTIEKFGYPATLVREYGQWVVLVRPAQVTLGSLILAAKSDATAFADLPTDAFAEQAAVVGNIERALRSFCDYEKLNYLMLMMVDPQVHFHVIPRYSAPRHWHGIDFPDRGWPNVPDLTKSIVLEEKVKSAMVDALRDAFD